MVLFVRYKHSLFRPAFFSCHPILPYSAYPFFTGVKRRDVIHDTWREPCSLTEHPTTATLKFIQMEIHYVC